MLDTKYIHNKKFVYIKFGSKTTLESMRKGNWWFWHPDKFRYEEIVNNDKVRGDCEDSLIEAHVVNQRIDKGQPLFSEANKYGIEYEYSFYRPGEEIDTERIICLYRLEIGEDGSFAQIDEKVKCFGDAMAFIRYDKFIDELVVKNIGVVDAYDIVYVGSCLSDGYRRKREKYNYQNEYRIRLCSPLYSQKINNNFNLHELSQKYSSTLRKMQDNTLGDQQRISAHNELCKLEIDRCKIKAKYKEELTNITEVLSDTYEIETALKARNIRDFI